MYSFNYFLTFMIIIWQFQMYLISLLFPGRLASKQKGKKDIRDYQKDLNEKYICTFEQKYFLFSMDFENLSSDQDYPLELDIQMVLSKTFQDWNLKICRLLRTLIYFSFDNYFFLVYKNQPKLYLMLTPWKCLSLLQPVSKLKCLVQIRPLGDC